MQNQLHRAALKESVTSARKNELYLRAVPDVRSQIKESFITITKVATVRRSRSEMEIIGDILRAASRNGGESVTALKQRVNLSQCTFIKYLEVMLRCNLLSSERPLDRSARTVIYKPTELGYDFVLKQRELAALLNAEGPELFSFRDW